MRGHLICVHIHKGAKILMCGGAVIAFKEVINHVFPIRLDVIGQAVAKGQILNIWCPMADFGF